jgi:hypothetical protein
MGVNVVAPLGEGATCQKNKQDEVMSLLTGRR